VTTVPERESWQAKSVAALAGLFLLGSQKRRSQKLRSLLAMLILVGAGMAIIGCSGGPTAGTTPATVTPQGSYNPTLVGTDTATSTITARRRSL